MSDGTVFPAFLRIEHQANTGAKSSFLAEITGMLDAGKRQLDQFNRDAQETGRVISSAISGGIGKSGGLDLNVGQFRQAAAEAKLYAAALRETERNAVALAASTGDTSQATRIYLTALQAQVVEAGRAVSAADAQVATYTRLQAALDATANRNSHLAASYREVYAEQARAAQGEVAARRYQEGINTVFAPAGSGKSAALSAAFFEEAARGANQLRSELDPMFAAQQRFDQEMVRADALLEQGAITQREYGQAVLQARANLTGANAAIHAAADAQNILNRAYVNAAKGTGATRFAYLQLGQQLQDISIQTQMGTNALLIFGQQVPQVAFALSGLGIQADGTQRGIGKLASFLAGPWGAAIFASVAVVGLLAESFFKMGHASDDAKKSTLDFSSSLNAQVGLVGNYTNAINQLADATKGLIDLQALLIDNTKTFAQGAVQKLQDQLRDLDQQLAGRRQQVASDFSPSGLVAQVHDPLTVKLENQRAATNALLNKALTSLGQAETAAEARTANEAAGDDKGKRAQIERERARLLERRNFTVANPITAQAGTGLLQGISAADFDKRMTELRKQEDALSKHAKTKGYKVSADDSAANFARDELDRVMNINRAWDDQPKLIDRAGKAAQDLRAIIADIELKQKDPRIGAGQIAALEEAKKKAQETFAVIDDGLSRPYRDLIHSQEDSLAVQRRILQGRDAEADALQIILQKQRDGNLIDAARAQAILNNVVALDKLSQAQRRVQDQQRAYLNALGQVRGGLETGVAGFRTQGIGSLKSIPDAIGKAFDQLNASTIVDKLFGGIFRQMEDKVTGRDKVRTANEAFAGMLDKTTDALERMKEALPGAANDNAISSVLSGGRMGAGIGILKAGSSAFAAASPTDNPITVTGSKIYTAADKLPAPIEFFGNILHKSFVDFFGPGAPIIDRLDDVVGFFKGTEGGALLGGGIASTFFGGNKTSSLLGTLGGAVGEKIGEKIGKKVGGFLGETFGPLGSIFGGLLGGALGGIISPAKKGTAVIGAGAGGLIVTGFSGNSETRKRAAGEGADSAISSIQKIAEALGGYVNAAAGAVSISVKKDHYYVDPTGGGATKTKKGAIDFGTDAAAAAKYATMNLIQDGVIAGLKASTQRLLTQGKDLDAAIQKALDFESVFTDLKAYTDPVGAAIDTLDKKFVHLKGIFTEAGASAAEYADLEKLYGIERAAAIKEAGERITASLKSLLDDLTIGDQGLSLRDRKSAALAQYQPLAAKVQAGDITAFDDFSTSARALLEIERQLSGSQGSYFALFNEIKSISQTAVDTQTSIANAAIGRDSPFGPSSVPAYDNSLITVAIQDQTQALIDALGPKLDAVNDNLGEMLQWGGDRGGPTDPFYSPTGTW